MRFCTLATTLTLSDQDQHNLKSVSKVPQQSIYRYVSSEDLELDYYVADHFLHSHHLFASQCIDVVLRSYMLITWQAKGQEIKSM